MVPFQHTLVLLTKRLLPPCYLRAIIDCIEKPLKLMKKPLRLSLVMRLITVWGLLILSYLNYNLLKRRNPHIVISLMIIRLNLNEFFVSANGFLMIALLTIRITKVKVTNKYTFNMGISYIKLKEYQNAIDAFKKAIKIKPDFYEAYTNMGGAYSKLKKYREAIKACSIPNGSIPTHLGTFD
jgi:tetratricopeptide (TPR) repeat protein